LHALTEWESHNSYPIFYALVDEPCSEMANGSMPDVLEDKIIKSVQQSVTGDYNPVTIQPTDDQAYALGNYEQEYQVHLITDSGREFATVEAYRKQNQWQVNFKRSTIGDRSL
jgi:hypothetical protein